MRFNKWILIFGLCFILVACHEEPLSTLYPNIPPRGYKFRGHDAGAAGMWVSAYLGAWNHYAPPGGNWGSIHTNEIDWNAFTQLIYFATTPQPDGSLSPVKAYHTFSPSRLKAIVTAAHSANKPILFTVGGWGSHPGFSSSITPGNRKNFVNNLIALLKKWKFDGIDLDMEPINQADVQNYAAFVKALHNALKPVKTPMFSKPRLVAATKWQPKMYAQLQNDFDEINLMTYDYSGPWPGWVTWYNAPVYDGGHNFPSTGRPLPSANQMVDEFVSDGVKPKKLGIGIDFYGYIWMGVDKPAEEWTETTAPRVSPNIPYWEIMNKYYKKKDYHWDNKSQSAYLSIDNDSSVLSFLPVKISQLLNSQVFISYDDKKSIQAKIDYVRKKKIGGVIVWELGGGFFKNKPAGHRDPLLQDVRHDVFGD
ncbi:MAG TPA: glycoside hydrolase family 18 protein [Balneolales bacterium]|nr:glycoside hydrolase family 18 protein [Balneolales bacterium]